VNVSTVDDLTGQARIRNAAIVEFAAHGYLKANVRDIAAAAGVSAGLVIHHFGSKAGLREVCDAYVLESLLKRARDDATASGVRDGIRDYLAHTSELHQQVQYVVKAIDEDSPTADKFVEALVSESEGVIEAGIADGSVRPVDDLRAMAVLTMLHSLSLLSMPPAIARALGSPEVNAEIMQRMALPSLELYTNGFYTDDRMLRPIRDALKGSEK
jgi:AcrR family transcriptional regulator